MSGSIQGPLEIGDLHNITTYRAGALQAAANRTLRIHCNEILSPYGITKIEWLAIGSILDAGEAGISLRDLAHGLDASPGRMTRIVRRLEKQQKVICAGWGKARVPIMIAIHPNFAPDCPEIERNLRQALRDSIYANITPLEFRMYLKVLYHLSRLP